MAAHSGTSIVNDGLVFSYDMSNTKKSWKGKPTTNIIASAGRDCSAEYSGNSYPFVSANITSQVKAAWSSSNNTFAMQFEGYRDYVAGGTGGGNDGYPVMYIYFTDWSWASTLGIGDYDWTYREKTFTMPDPTNKSIYFAIYHMNSTNRGRSYARNFQIEQSSFPTPFVNGTRSSTESIIDIVGDSSITTTFDYYNSDNTFEYINSNNDYAIATGSAFKNGMGQYTIAHWSRRDVESKMPVATASDTQFYWYGDNSWRYTHGGTGGEYYYPKSVSIPAGTWGYYVATYDGSNVKIYRNGVYEGSKATTGVANWAQGMKIGGWASSSSYAYDGKIDAVQFYDRALTAQEVKQNFEAKRMKYGI